VLGPGCPKCGTFYDNVILALDELGLEATVEWEELPPRLVVDGKVVSQGGYFP